MINAAKGKGASQNGMNIPEMIAVLKANGLADPPKDRAGLNAAMVTLVTKLGAGAPAGAPAAFPVVAAPKAAPKAVYKPKPGNVVLGDVPNAKMLRKEGRLSAAEYFRDYKSKGINAIGDICDPRKNGQLQCLRSRGPDSAYWYSKSSQPIPAECQPWKKRCRLAGF